LSPDAGGDDVFVQFSALPGKGRRNLTEGESVEFEIVDGKAGAEAREVERTA
ncbi:MAG: cold shock domain-containing protein, partial [Gemmatimonadota bacterium]|nr:cold shock domain-containing protein [Gemmatimonadota bacterium]